VDSIVARKGRERERFDERGKAGAFGYCRRGGDEKDGGMLFVVKALRKSMDVSEGLTKSDLAGSETSDSEEEEDSSEVSSSDSVGWPEMPLGVGSTAGEGMRLNESDKNDDGCCSGSWISNVLGVNQGIQVLLAGDGPSWGAK